LITVEYLTLDTQLHSRPKEQHPGNSQAKGPLNNNSGKQA